MPPSAISFDEIRALDAYWRAANYLTVGQIYLVSKPLLREPLRTQDIKPRLLGHWGTSPGLSLLYVHLNRLILNRLIRQQDLNVVYCTGPGNGGRPTGAPKAVSGTKSGHAFIGKIRAYLCKGWIR